jgi:hypothetical protein
MPYVTLPTPSRPGGVADADPPTDSQSQRPDDARGLGTGTHARPTAMGLPTMSEFLGLQVRFWPKRSMNSSAIANWRTSFARRSAASLRMSTSR